MKLSQLKLLIIAPALVLTACGYGLKEVYSGVPYNSTVFTENYFNVWKDSINPNKEGNKITVKKDTYELDEEKDNVFTSLKDVSFKNCDDNFTSYAYTYDKDEPTDGTVAYGPAISMSKLDNSFNYGVSSKLFDGQMFCNGDYQNSRTQVEPTNQGSDKGFGLLFSKECNDASYFMMNFKCSLVGQDDQDLEIGMVYSDLTLHLGFYLRNDTGYTYVPLTYKVNDVPTNSGDDIFSEGHAGRWKMYTCFGFKLDNIDTSRLIGFSLQYEKTGDTYSALHPDVKTYHAMMLYEVSFPHTTWH